MLTIEKLETVNLSIFLVKLLVLFTNIKVCEVFQH